MTENIRGQEAVERRKSALDREKRIVLYQYSLSRGFLALANRVESFLYTSHKLIDNPDSGYTAESHVKNLSTLNNTLENTFREIEKAEQEPGMKEFVEKRKAKRKQRQEEYDKNKGDGENEIKIPKTLAEIEEKKEKELDLAKDKLKKTDKKEDIITEGGFIA